MSTPEIVVAPQPTRPTRATSPAAQAPRPTTEKQTKSQQRRLAAETAELAAQRRKDRREERRLRTFNFEPPAMVHWFYETLVVPTLRESDTVVERMQKLLIATSVFVIPVLSGCIARHTYIAFERPRPDDTPGAGGRWGSLEFVIEAFIGIFCILVYCTTLIYIRIRKEVAVAIAAELLAVSLGFIIVFPTHVTFPVYAGSGSFCVFSVFIFGPEYPVWTCLSVVMFATLALWSDYNLNSLLSVSFFTAADINASLYNNSSNSSSLHPSSNVSDIKVGNLKAQRVSLLVHYTNNAFFVGSPFPYLGTTAERFINWFLAFNLAATTFIGLVSFMSQMGVVARQQLANAAAGRTMAAALRNFDIARLEDAVDQYKALPYRDDGMWAHLQSMAQHIALLGRFCPRDIITALRQDGDRPAEAGLEERASVCVLVCELCNTCRLIEKVRPERELEKLLNGITTRVTQIVAEHGGTLLATDGCQFRAVWGAPQRLHAKHSGVLACCAALHLVHMLREEFATMVERQFGVHNLRFRVGIHRGPAVVGNIGSTVGNFDQESTKCNKSNNTKDNNRPAKAHFLSRCEYIVSGEAVQIATIAALLGSNRNRSAVMITRNVLMDDSSRRDVQHATDLVNFAVREVCLFAHDTKPLQVFTGLQLIGITSAGRDLVQQTTRRINNTAPVEEQQQEEQQQEQGQQQRLQKQNDEQTAAAKSPSSSSSSCSSSMVAASASQILLLSKRCKLRSSSNGGRRAGRDVQRVRHMWNASESDNSASDSDINGSNTGTTPANVTCRGTAAPRNFADGAAVSFDSVSSHTDGDNNRPSAAAAGSNHRDETRRQREATQQEVPTAVASPTFDAALEQAVSALSEQHRNIIKWSLRTVLTDNFAVDDLGCDVLQTLTQVQQVLSSGARGAAKEADRLCTLAILNPITAAERAETAAATRGDAPFFFAPASLPSSSAARPNIASQLQCKHISPGSNFATKKVLMEALVTKAVVEVFLKRCAAWKNNASSLLLVNVEMKCIA